MKKKSKKGYTMNRIDEINSRLVELRKLLEGNEEVDLNAIELEINALDEERKALTKSAEIEERKAMEEAEKRRNIAEKINEGEIKPVEIEKKGDKKMDIEKRNTKEYIDAYGEYLKRGLDALNVEQRTLLTENVSGNIAVPELVYDIIKTAWEKEGIMSLVKKIQVKGNLKVNFERSSTGAVFHTEGAEAITNETLTHGIVTLMPKTAKKCIALSDEVYAMRGEELIRYLVEELTHKINKLLADTLVGKIVALPQTNTATSVSADKVAMNPSATTIATAISHLSDEAENPVIMMNKLSYANFKEVQYANNYGVDVFENCKVLFNNTLPAFGSASTNDVYAIVGDLGFGALANFPNGTTIDITFDNLTRKKEDLIEIMGKEYVALDLIADKSFVLLAKTTA